MSVTYPTSLACRARPVGLSPCTQTWRWLSHLVSRVSDLCYPFPSASSYKDRGCNVSMLISVVTDGLWNYMEPADVAGVLRQYLDQTEKLQMATEPPALIAEDSSTTDVTIISTGGVTHANLSQHHIASHELSSGRCKGGVDGDVVDHSADGDDTTASETSSSSKQEHIVGGEANGKGVSTAPSAAAMLLEQCLRNAALAGGTSYESLKTMPCGPYKRNIVDDITVIVVLLGKCAVLETDGTTADGLRSFM